MRRIRMTETDIAQVLKNVEAALKTQVNSTDSINYKIDTSVKPEGVPEKLDVEFTDKAYFKLTALVDQCSSEVGWHGTVVRNGNRFIVQDILVFPQYVTGATVTPDATEYAMWLQSHEDAVFNAIRFHGHSHVNMGVSPSGVDTTYQQQLAQQVQDYYIFGIFNKKEDWHLTIYDVTNNLLYENKDIDMYIPEMYVDWAKEQITTHVKRHTYTQATDKQTGQMALGTYAQQSRYYDSVDEYDNMSEYDRINKQTGWEKGKVWDSKKQKYVWPASTVPTTYYCPNTKRTVLGSYCTGLCNVGAAGTGTCGIGMRYAEQENKKKTGMDAEAKQLEKDWLAKKQQKESKGKGKNDTNSLGMNTKMRKEIMDTLAGTSFEGRVYIDLTGVIRDSHTGRKIADKMIEKAKRERDAQLKKMEGQANA